MRRQSRLFRGILLCCAELCLQLLAARDVSAAQHSPVAQRTVDAEGHQWWQHAVFYELYPRSFADSNDDGVGDLNGIAGKLDYLRDLGVDALWITPCFPSPQVDFGYDVADYRNIDPMYGTLQDFDRLLADARRHGIRILLDFVMNHTSDRHPWFMDSRTSRASRHRDWYVWRDGKAAGVPPNNWLALFGHSAWEYDAASGQYYYHFFYPQQPDLNWRNPEVKREMFDTTRWWYQRGVAGFRLDAVDTLFEDPQLRDNPVLPGTNRYGDPNMRNEYNQKLAQNKDILQELRAQADQYGTVLIGETNPKDISELKEYYGGGQRPGVQMPMDYLFTNVKSFSAAEYRAQIAAVENTGGWPVYVISNHDIPRPVSRYGDGRHDDAIAKLLAGLYLTLRGTPIMYYGEELGMTNTDPTRREEVKDPIGRLGWPQEKGRDGERTPMQWTAGANAGFTRGTPWLPVASSATTHNVASELTDPNSVLGFYRRLLKLRHTNRALLDGSYVALNGADPNVLSFAREYRHQAVVVLLNMSAAQQSAQVGVPGFSRGRMKALLRTPGVDENPSAAHRLDLPPFAVYIGQIDN